MNHASISGRLGRDPELKKTVNGVSACSFSLAVKRAFAKDTEQDTDWINVQAWRQSADYICDHAGKGDLIGVEGRIQTRTYTGRDGLEKTVTEIVAERVEILQTVTAKPAASSETTVNQSRTPAANRKRQEIPAATPEDIARWAYEETGEIVNPDDLPF